MVKMEGVIGGQWSLASQGRVLCQQYIITRSLRAGAQLKKIRSLFHSCSGKVDDDISIRFLEILSVMESLNPSIFDSCSAKLKVTMCSEEQVRWAYDNITSHLLQTGITWGKVISIFTLCGAIASDCVSQGHTGFLPLILDLFEESCSQPVLNQYLKNIKGWQGMIDHYTECLEEKKTAKSEPVTVCQLLDNAQQVLQQISKQNDVVFITVICLIVLVSSFTLSKLMAIIQDRLAPG